jgi:hypothetical protein
MPYPTKVRYAIFVISTVALLACFGCRKSELNVRQMIQPDYPVPARMKNIQGTVTLGIVIGIDGKVTDVHGSGADQVLIEAAEKNARDWTWGPFPAKFEYPHYHEILYTYRLRGKSLPVVMEPPMVNTDLPDRIEIIGTPYYSDLPLNK